MSDEGIYSVNELLDKEIRPCAPIIDGFIWEKDNVLIVGHEKAGKSVLAMQIAFAISSGQPLFGEFAVQKPCNVLYIQTEGKIPQTAERIREMLKMNDCDPNKLYIAYYPNLGLDTQEGMELFRLELDKTGFKPEVIIVDPLYHSMKGSLIDEQDARKMTANMRVLMERYGCAIVIVHHTHKPIRHEGKMIAEGDNSIFGSFVWKAWADHTFLFRVDKTKLRILSCDTQRSGKVVDYQELKLIGTPFLGLERKEDESKNYEISIRRCIEESGGEGMTREEIVTTTGVSLSTVEKSLRRLIEVGEVIKCTKKRPVKYWSKAVVATQETQSSLRKNQETNQ